MLLLTRKIGESVNIGNDVTVTVVGVQEITQDSGTAPRSVPVHREEVYNRIEQGDKDGNR